jgi:hypothetical protein
LACCPQDLCRLPRASGSNSSDSLWQVGGPNGNLA